VKNKIYAFGITDGCNKVGWPHRMWTDDIIDWCKTSSYPMIAMLLYTEQITE